MLKCFFPLLFIVLCKNKPPRNPESLKVLKHPCSVSTARFQVCRSVTQTAAWTVDLHCEELVGAGGDVCFSACLCHRPAICGSVKPGRTPRTGKRRHACGRKGSEEWRNWELWSIYWSRTSPAPNRCRIVVCSQRQEGSTAEKDKQVVYCLVAYLWLDWKYGPCFYIREIQTQPVAMQQYTEISWIFL